MSARPIQFAISKGLLEHKPRMGAAIWEYLWFIDKVTKDEPDGNGKFNGLVLGGTPFKADVIAHDLHEHVQTAFHNIRKLEREGYVIRKRHAGNRCSFKVTNSKKWLRRRMIENAHSDTGRVSETTHSERAKTLTPVIENAHTYKERQYKDSTVDNTEEKPAPRTKRSEADPRFSSFVGAVKSYWDSKNTISFSWDDSDGKQLKHLLAASPKLTVEQFTQCLANRAASEVAHGERPRYWLGNVQKYGNGPLDRFGKPAKQSTSVYHEIETRRETLARLEREKGKAM